MPNNTIIKRGEAEVAHELRLAARSVERGCGAGIRDEHRRARVIRAMISMLDEFGLGDYGEKLRPALDEFDGRHCEPDVEVQP